MFGLFKSGHGDIKQKLIDINTFTPDPEVEEAFVHKTKRFATRKRRKTMAATVSTWEILKDRVSFLSDGSSLVNITFPPGSTSPNIMSTLERLLKFYDDYSYPSGMTLFELSQKIIHDQATNRYMLRIPQEHYVLLRRAGFVLTYTASPTNLERKSGFKLAPIFPILMRMYAVDESPLSTLSSIHITLSWLLTITYPRRATTLSEQIPTFLYSPTHDNFRIYRRLHKILELIFIYCELRPSWFNAFFERSQSMTGLLLLANFLCIRTVDYLHVRFIKECDFLLHESIELRAAYGPSLRPMLAILQSSGVYDDFGWTTLPEVLETQTDAFKLLLIDLISDPRVPLHTAISLMASFCCTNLTPKEHLKTQIEFANSLNTPFTQEQERQQSIRQVQVVYPEFSQEIIDSMSQMTGLTPLAQAVSFPISTYYPTGLIQDTIEVPITVFPHAFRQHQHPPEIAASSSVPTHVLPRIVTTSAKITFLDNTSKQERCRYSFKHQLALQKHIHHRFIYFSQYEKATHSTLSIPLSSTFDSRLQGDNTDRLQIFLILLDNYFSIDEQLAQPFRTSTIFWDKQYRFPLSQTIYFDDCFFSTI